MHETQALAARIVARVLSGKNLNQALVEITPKSLADPQRAALQDMTYGTLRFYGLLSAVLQGLVDRPLKDELIYTLTLVALYQLNYTRAVDHAIVNHAVQACVSLRKTSAKSLVNAVLRKFLRDKEGVISRARETTDIAAYSHPLWWIEKLKAQYPGDWQRILTINNAHPPMTLRTNAKVMAAPEYLKILDDNGIAAQLIGDVAIKLKHAMRTGELPGFAEGWVSVQDAGAQLAAPLLKALPGMRVLDACSAPGGKAAHLLERHDVNLTALDHDADRLKKVEQTFSRLGLSGACVLGDASDPGPWWDGLPYDRILADVPCSASGIVRRHPDIKWLRRDDDTQRFVAQQAVFLDALWRLLAQGGKLLYATCSIFHEENHMQTEAFLMRTPDAKLEPWGERDCSGQILPNEDHDGFYYALLAKQP